MSKRNKDNTTAGDNLDLRKRRRDIGELAAAVGILLIAVALIVPIVNLASVAFLNIFKWVYAAGALIYLVGRMIGVANSEKSLRIKRMRRMQAWAGLAFAIGAWFWFYQESHLPIYAGSLAILRNTVVFSLAGAVLQIVSAWMISSRLKKEGL